MNMCLELKYLRRFKVDERNVQLPNFLSSVETRQLSNV